MSQCHLLESIGVPDVQLFCGLMSHPKKTWKGLTFGSFMGQCHLLESMGVPAIRLYSGLMSPP